MKGNIATADLMAWPISAWLLLSFSPFPVCHLAHGHCTSMDKIVVVMESVIVGNVWWHTEYQTNVITSLLSISLQSRENNIRKRRRIEWAMDDGSLMWRWEESAEQLMGVGNFLIRKWLRIHSTVTPSQQAQRHSENMHDRWFPTSYRRLSYKICFQERRTFFSGKAHIFVFL